MTLTVGSLFSGIGGIDLGLERAGMQVKWQVEIDPWCRRVLAKHWPDVPKYGDIKTVIELPYVDVIAGGFPCQPVSVAGKRLGQDDERWLWPEFERIIRLVRPRYVLVENVPGLLGGGMLEVLGSLAKFGLDAEWQIISAADVGAPHRRDRIWIVAYPDRLKHQNRPPSQRWPSTTVVPADANGSGCHKRTGKPGAPGRHELEDGNTWAAAYADGLRQSQPRWIFPESGERIGDGGWWSVEPDVVRMVYGVPGRVDRLRGLGNAVVPQVVEYIGERIIQHAYSQQEATR